MDNEVDMARLQRLIFLGASPFGESFEIVKDINSIKPTYEIEGILDDDPSAHGRKINGIPVLGKISEFSKYPDVKFIMCIGSYRTRLAKYNILKKLNLPDGRYETLIHPEAKIYANAKVGPGSIIYKGAVIFNDTAVGRFCSVLPNSVIGVRNRILEGAMISPLVATTPDAVIGHYAHIGAASCIGEKVKIGPCAQVGMGSTILKDVPPGTFCMGSYLKQVFLDKIEVPPPLIEEWNKVVKAR